MMIFPSWGYFVFLACVVLIYWRLPRLWQNILLLTASYVFYAAWNWHFLFLIAGSTTIAYIAALGIHQSQKVIDKQICFLVSVGVSIGLLCYFKYSNFFIDSLNTLFSSWHLNVSLMHLDLILPLGISFYTFQLISYVTEAYRQTIVPTKSFVDLGLFIAFFPKLLAGPIERPKGFLVQLQQDRVFRAEQFWEGIDLLIWALVKKLAIADNIGLFVNMIFALKDPCWPIMYMGAIGFGIQLFADFSAYTDFARGSAKVMGLELSKNFNKPFLSRDPSDFWNRWHMSLTAWMKDYLYMPLVFRLSKMHMALGYILAIIISWGFIGIWHGAEDKYLAWGLYYAVLIIIYQFAAKPLLANVWRDNLFTTAASILCTWLLVNLGFLMIRVPSLDLLWTQLKVSVTTLDIDTIKVLAIIYIFYAIPLLVALAWERWLKHSQWKLEDLYGLRVFLYTVAALILIIFAGVNSYDFIYFQF